MTDANQGRNADTQIANDESPFHEGERQVQQRMGVRDDIEPWARKVVRSVLSEQHRNFYAGLPFLVAAARDARGQPWATLLVGAPGFAHSPEPGRLAIEAQTVAGDALNHALVDGTELGILGIELSTRRRNRVNGRVRLSDGRRLDLAVEQAFGNCPQYIHPREWTFVDAPRHAAPHPRRATLSADNVTWIEDADTMFIASGHSGEGESPSFGMDASHRGGEPGFVRVLSDTTLVFPDYAGNNHYNTIGNLTMDPRVGLLFVDFQTGGMLQLTGRATIEWDSARIAEFPGAQRLVAIAIEEVIELPAAILLRWTADSGAVRTLRLVEKTEESEEITSFTFEARDGGVLADFEPGQHLPIELRLAGRATPERRTYSLSNGPSRGRYRISVKRESHGLVSRALHDGLEVGDFIDAQLPAGDFVLENTGRRVVLVSAGVGVTPMLSMFHALLEARDPRPVSFFHAARDRRHHVFADEVRSLANQGQDVSVHVSFSRPGPDDRQGLDYDTAGRLDAERVSAELPSLDAEYYLCGPVAFMAAMQDGLEALGVAGERIHSETFGPATTVARA